MLLAFAAAGGALMSPAATADTGCTLADGYSSSLAAYVSEAATCVAQSEAVQTATEIELADQTNAARASLGLNTLERRDSLDQAARAHALDMATRGYAAHQDLEGRDHLYRIGAFDRTMLVGSSGANVMKMAGDVTANDVFVSMGQDVQNAQNIIHSWFTDFGVGIAEANGETYAVMLFAANEGELDTALPIELTETAPLSASFKRDLSQAVGWSLHDQATGDQLAKGSAPRLRTAQLGTGSTASLELVISEQADTYALKGPLVSAR